MSSKAKTAISPTRAEDFPEWYQQVVRAGDLAENAEVRGCMVIKPWGYGIWESIQSQFDQLLKETGHENAYFPLLIPLSYFEKEAKHVEGFAPECAVVTHHRLRLNAEGKMVPDGELSEPLVVRPTSEMIIGAAFARWVESYRDLPLLINQWANVMRWEMRPRVFLRTAEFLWQEGHTAHETEAEARQEYRKVLQLYAQFAREHLALPVIAGVKTENERFPGALDSLTVEAMMQDRKAIQGGTSHFFGTNFAEASGIEFTGRQGKKQFAWTTSWGISTRLIGGLIMAHGDDDGMIVPPRVAPKQVVILPVIPQEEKRAEVLEACHQLEAQMREKRFHEEKIRVQVDERDWGGGEKNWDWIKKGVPVRVEIGPRDLEKGQVAVAQRDRAHREKDFVDRCEFVETLEARLQKIQNTLLERAAAYRKENTREIASREEFYAFFTPQNEEKPEIHGGFAQSYWGGSNQEEEQLKKDLKVTARCIPFEQDEGEGVCFYTGKRAKKKVIFAKAY